MIEPVNLPSGAGINYSDGDVRHLAQGDAMDVPGISNPTRELAERDNIIAETVNELVQAVNNQEQPIALPVYRTVMPPGEETIVANYRIPAGFEARVLDAAVAANPASNSVQLNVLYSTGFGNSTGTSVVTATPGSEFTGQVSFSQQGEFIISIKNTGALTLEVTASILLTMRPLGAVGTLLIGTVVEGPPGIPGMTGPQGPVGPPGAGSTGSPGLVWTGTWSFLTAYNVNDAVSYTESTGAVSAFICTVANTGIAPQGSADWDYLAQGGLQGPAGPQGPSNSALNYATSYGNSGTATYTLTTSAALFNLNPTPPSLTLNAAGTYMLFARTRIDAVGANWSTGQRNLVFFLYDDTNSVTVPNSVRSVTLAEAIYGQSYQTTVPTGVIPPVPYQINGTTTVQMWGSLSSSIAGGTFQVIEADIVAIQIG
jgi:hypothetical protein